MPGWYHTWDPPFSASCVLRLQACTIIHTYLPVYWDYKHIPLYILDVNGFFLWVLLSCILDVWHRYPFCEVFFNFKAYQYFFLHVCLCNTCEPGVLVDQVLFPEDYWDMKENKKRPLYTLSQNYLSLNI